MMLLCLVGGLGLMVGFLIGVVFRDALDLYRASRKEPRMAKTPGPGKILYFGLAVSLILNVAVAVLVGITLTTTSSYTACTGSWAQDFSSGYKARYEASVKVSTAMDDIVEAVGTQDRTKFAAAVERYRDLRASQKGKQKANPLPPLPETVCGKPLS